MTPFDFKKYLIENQLNQNQSGPKMTKSKLKEMIKSTIIAELENPTPDDIEEAKKKKKEEPESDINLDDIGNDDSTDLPADEPTPNKIPDIDTSEVNPTIKAVQDALTQAQAAAEKLGDDKLLSQIGNTITFFTRTHISEKPQINVDHTDTVAEDEQIYEEYLVNKMHRIAGLKK